MNGTPYRVRWFVTRRREGACGEGPRDRARRGAHATGGKIPGKPVARTRGHLGGYLELRRRGSRRWPRRQIVSREPGGRTESRTDSPSLGGGESSPRSRPSACVSS